MNISAVICKHIALFVPDLRAAEDFYGRVFEMELLFGESNTDGEESWYALPSERGWEDAERAGSSGEIAGRWLAV